MGRISAKEAKCMISNKSFLFAKKVFGMVSQEYRG